MFPFSLIENSFPWEVIAAPIVYTVIIFIKNNYSVS